MVRQTGVSSNSSAHQNLANSFEASNEETRSSSLGVDNLGEVLDALEELDAQFTHAGVSLDVMEARP